MITPSPVGFERQSNLPQFGQTTIAMRVSLLVPMIVGELASFDGHTFFEGVREWHRVGVQSGESRRIYHAAARSRERLPSDVIHLPTKQKFALLLYVRTSCR